ncbi:Chloroplast-targeted copper chaperone-like protein [Hibiscus syriacus]|uniref:Chloroplast-targeted copper chaperone-like protein n=1 Tax=Hibiscus syriacus TaxID=106335 RepID=A0A6A2YYX4_HIBSY|nr:Chloroplast-targeted copper chaperone-like protein [Hibiscus syriacus]
MVRDRDFGRDIAISPLSELPATAAIASATVVIAPVTAVITVSFGLVCHPYIGISNDLKLDNYLSSTYRAPQCHSTQCARAGAHDCHTCSSRARLGCHNNMCELVSVNPVMGLTAIGKLAQDILSIHSTPVSNLGPLVMIPHSALTFALCLSTNGVIFFGGGPYYMHPGIDISRPLSYTPLMISPQGEYNIEVKSIKINNKDIPINATLSSVDRRGLGGAKLSKINPYTILQHSIFKSVTEIFTKELSDIPLVKPMEPFGVYFNSKSIQKGSRVGPRVPYIDLAP